MLIKKIGNQAFLHLLYVSISLRRGFNIKRTPLKNSLNPVARVSTKSPAFQKFPSAKRSPRNWIFQEDKYADFIANYTINVFNNVTEKNCPTGSTFVRYDDYIVLDRKITNELHM